MDTTEKTQKYFLIGTIILGVLIIAGLIWAISLGPGEGGGNIDPNILFNDQGNPQAGNKDAKVTVRIYSDFQCPACKMAESELKKVIEKYQDRVNFYWNDFPLSSIHQNAASAAVAGRCAQEQNAFWQYADLLYQSQEKWQYLKTPTDFYADLAEQLGLQKENFSKCLTLESAKQKVQNDYLEAVNMKLDSTPTFFINRKIKSGAMSLDQWSEILDQELQ
ncbi:DsbA family protein [Patescibacteria group bacterium]|nr:DsbA family protein [Patescibacteria group bacterium]